MHHNSKRSAPKTESSANKKRKVALSTESDSASIETLSDEHINLDRKGKAKAEDVMHHDLDQITFDADKANTESDAIVTAIVKNGSTAVTTMKQAINKDAEKTDEGINKEVEKTDNEFIHIGVGAPRRPTGDVTAIAHGPIPDMARLLTELPLLQEVLSISKTKDKIDLVKVININEVFDERVVKRLRTLEVFPSCGASKNLAMATPSDYIFGMGGYPTYICDRITRYPARFFIIGTCRYSSLFNGDRARQAAVTMSDRTFPRAAAFLAAVTRQEVINIQTFRDGMSFSTYRDSGSSKGLRPASPEKLNGKYGPLRSVKNPVVLPANQDVPAFDGRKPFNLNDYAKLKKLPCEIGNDCAVLVAFTVSTYPLGIKFHDKDVRLSMSFNIQFIILLNEPGEQSFLPPDEPIGIIPLDNKDHDGELGFTEDVKDDGDAPEEAGPSLWI